MEQDKNMQASLWTGAGGSQSTWEMQEEWPSYTCTVSREQASLRRE
jgi:hypothetical protein